MVDNLITLYEYNETEFKTNGLGSLIDAASCSVHEERNGEFELTMEYPVTGRHFSDLIMRRIIFARPNPHDNAQPFRIYSISKPINGVITINARHISYDLDGYSLAPFDKSSLLDVFEEMNRQMKEPWNSDKPPFHFSTTKTGAASMFNLVAPCSMRAILGGSEGTILDRWHGEYEWDIWEVKYHQNRGADRGVTIEYGKNLTNLEQEESCDNCWTSVYPYYYMEPQEDEEGDVTGGLVELDEKIIRLSGTYNYSRTLVLDLTSKFDGMPTKEDLKSRAQKYIDDNELGSPKVSLTVSFLPLSETTAYSKLKILEEVKLCDTVHVYFPRLNVASTAMCISTTYNVLTNKYTEIELGDAKSDLASTLAGQGNDTEKRIQSALNSNNSFLEEAIKRQTKMITGNLGGYVVLHDTNGDGMPDELLIMDAENIQDARNIWRANQAGVGHSSTGYNGDYTTGWTMDGHFNASLITVGELWANIIKVGILSDQKGYNYWNLETGEFRMATTAMVGDQTIPDIANAALDDAKQYTNNAINNQSQEFIFNKLTNNGAIQGLYMQNGNLYVNAKYMVTGKLASKNGKVYFDLDNNELHCDTLVSTGATSPAIAKIGTLLFPNGTGNYTSVSGFIVYKEGYDTGGIAISVASSSSGYPAIIGPTASGVRFGADSMYNGWSSGSSGITVTPNGYIGIYAGVSKARVTPSDIESTDFESWGTRYNDRYGMIVIRPCVTEAFDGDLSSGGRNFKIDGEMLFRSERATFSRVVRTMTLNSQFLYGDGGSSTGCRVYGTITNISTSSYVGPVSSYAQRVSYGVESSTPITSDIGEGQTDENGECYIYLDELFRETIADNMEYQVFLQKEGPGDIWISEKNSNYFIVKGTENLKFAWEVKAHIKGNETDRLEVFEQEGPSEDPNPEDLYVDEMIQLELEEEEALLNETA